MRRAAVPSTATLLLPLLAAAIAALVAWLPDRSFAQNRPDVLRVATYSLPPLAMERANSWTGFSIELWQEIANRLKVNIAYQRVDGVDAALDMLREHRADVLVSGVYMTADRDREFEFSHPILEAGQQIMVREGGAASLPNPLVDMLGLLFSKTTLAWFGLAVVLLLVPAHIVWFLERGEPDGISPDRKYLPGILSAIHWSATTMMSQGDRTPRRAAARLVSFLWMFVSLVFVALYTAQLTANLTVAQFQGTINGPDDLPGKRVGTLKGSVSTTYLDEHNAKTKQYPSLDEMYQALQDRKVDAVLLATPPLRYFVAHEGKGLVRIVGPEFHKGQAAFVFPEDSPWRRLVNEQLLLLREDGTYQGLYDKWFGRD